MYILILNIYIFLNLLEISQLCNIFYNFFFEKIFTKYLLILTDIFVQIFLIYTSFPFRFTKSFSACSTLFF